jgi:phosphate:Na+ symporter
MSLWLLIASSLICIVLLLLVMKLFSDSLKSIVEKRIKQLLKRVGDRPVLGYLLGVLLSVVLQSTGVVVVLSIALTHTGILTVAAANAILIGAHLGVTSLLQFIAYDVIAIGPWIAGLGLVTWLIPKYKKYGLPIIYLGVFFVLLQAFAYLAAQLGANEAVIQLIRSTQQPWLLVLIAVFATFLIQSGSVVIVLAVVLSSQQLISIEQILYLVAGANLGSTLSALAISLPVNLQGKRTALGHAIYSLMGVVLILPFVPIYIRWLPNLGANLDQQVANFVLIFNAVTSLFVLVFFGQFMKLVYWLSHILEKFVQVFLPEKHRGRILEDV